MKIMLIEDDIGKCNAISNHLIQRGVLENEIIFAKNLTDFAAHMHEDIGLFVIDLKLPSIDNGSPSLNGKAILETLIKAGKDQALLLAISSYPNDFPEVREYFESRGCILADYSRTAVWKSALDHLLIQLKKEVDFDFLIFCALQIERNPYCTIMDGSQVIRRGIDCYDINIGDKKGSVILLPKMGLVNAAVTASICIDRFKPVVVGMSGICGGFAGRAKKGQLFVSSMAYEYQSGKWASDGFQQEPYQVPTDHNTLIQLRSLVSTQGLINELEVDFNGSRPEERQNPEIGIFTSGSAVIADQTLMNQIKQIHRKVEALDMEVFALHRAAELSLSKPSCICAKTVVDLCDKKKDDKLHSYGSYISAKFMIKAIQNFFAFPQTR